MASRILGGGPTGRLFLDVREEKGLTYGVYSQMEPGQAPGTWTGATGLTILVYRGATAGAAAIHYSTESGPQTLPALNLSGTPSWVAGIGHWLTSLDSSPSGLTQRHAYEWGGLWVAAWDTGGDVTSWSATQVGPTAAAWSWLAASIQLIPN